MQVYNYFQIHLGISATPRFPDGLHVKRPSQYVTRLQTGEGSVHTWLSKKSDIPKGIILPPPINEAKFTTQIEHTLVSIISGTEEYDPTSLKEARSQSDWKLWEEAIHKELAALKDA